MKNERATYHTLIIVTIELMALTCCFIKVDFYMDRGEGALQGSMKDLNGTGISVISSTASNLRR
ncbi:hypothetical protein NV381_36825 [Paenibacillus sp. N5-1-1-5]|uniref:Uncharacterized protein n=1 Tax=Paenibacillus radicis (ex Xue et al. 2023) TaxID=2972489 RepID=A0ABT1YU71_9BACL|nr:hypothetical protein [Paenibacillus radicis (ex Xue et al. 2023)]